MRSDSAQPQECDTETFWFILVALMVIAYVVLDGFDLGAGIISLFVARTHDERHLILRAIGPVWDGNEVWLVAAAGALFFAFPPLYAASFSGFYLPLMIVLWLLMLRGIGSSSAPTLMIRSGGRSSILYFPFPACCSQFFSGQRSAMSFAACRSVPTGIFLKRFGQISRSARIPAFSTGTPL